MATQMSTTSEDILISEESTGALTNSDNTSIPLPSEPNTEEPDDNIGKKNQTDHSGSTSSTTPRYESSSGGLTGFAVFWVILIVIFILIVAIILFALITRNRKSKKNYNFFIDY